MSSNTSNIPTKRNSSNLANTSPEFRDRVMKRANEERAHKCTLLILLFVVILPLLFSALYLLSNSYNDDNTVTSNPFASFHQSSDFPRKKELFLQKYGDKYGYNKTIDEIRRTQTPHLNGLTLFY